MSKAEWITLASAIFVIGVAALLLLHTSADKKKRAREAEFAAEHALLAAQQPERWNAAPDTQARGEDSGYPTRRERQKDLWYEGGTLHRATLGEWRGASYENRLATAGDWLAAARRDRYSSMDALKRDAIRLVADVDEGAKDSSLASLSATEFAGGVMILWGNQ